MYTEEQMESWKSRINDSTDISQTATEISKEMMSIGKESAGFNQGQIVKIMQEAQVKGAPHYLFDEPINQTNDRFVPFS
jgi:hypothetical protein